mgnify:CR=1 FL=1
MPTWLIISLLVFGVIVLCLLVDSDKKTKRQLDDLFANRNRSDDNEYYDIFFSDSGIPKNVVSRIRSLFSEHIGVDLSLLEADDDFSTDYSLIWDLDSMADVEIVISLEKEFGIEISDGEASAAPVAGERP